jgi:hypothetical protein
VRRDILPGLNERIFGAIKKCLFSRLRLKLATIYASLVNLDNVGETLVTNAQFSNGDLQITIYGWDKVRFIFFFNF